MGIKAFNHGDDFVNKFVRAIVSDSTGLDAVQPFTPESGLTATGGVISDFVDSGNVYRTHIFTSSGIFNVTDDTSDFGTNIEYLVVGGGGGAGGRSGGGGGAGGLRTNLSGHPLAGSAYPVSTTNPYTCLLYTSDAADE